jgi:hypothetical protein
MSQKKHQERSTIASRLKLAPYVYSEPGYKPKEIYTTSEIVTAVVAKIGHDLPNSFTYSIPVIQEIKERKYLLFFIFSISGSYSNRKIYPPRFRVSCPIDSLNELELEAIQPQTLNINAAAKEPLGQIENVSSLPTQADIESKFLPREEEKLNDAIDHLLMIYPKTPQGLIDVEKAYARTYQDIFNDRQTTKFLLPAYKALSPYFFDWLDNVLK